MRLARCAAVVGMEPKLPFRSLPSGHGLFKAGKTAQMSHFVVVPYVRTEFPCVFHVAHTRYSAFVRAVLSLVQAVGFLGNIPQVFPSVIVSNAIDVVNLTFGRGASHHAPDYSVGFKSASANKNRGVSLFFKGCRNLVAPFFVPSPALLLGAVFPPAAIVKHTWSAGLPSKLAGFGAVIKNLTQVVSRWYRARGHYDLLSRLFWQVGGGVGAPSSAPIIPPRFSGASS